MWVFYYAMYGPGHQSGDSGFEYFGDNYQKETIRNSLMAKFDDQDSVVLRWWKVDKPNVSCLNIKIGEAQESIKIYKRYLKIMQKQKSFVPKGKDGVDKTFQNNLKRKVFSDVLRKLHKAGFMYNERDITEWSYGREWTIPVEPDRSKILRIIRKADSYPLIKS